MYTGFVGIYSKLAHLLMERPYNKKSFDKILEVGAGHGEHLSAVRCDFEEYIQSDIDIKLLKITKKLPRNVKNISLDAQDLSIFKDNEFDRVVVTCLLAHLDNPRAALIEWQRVVKNGGFITLYIPTEMGLLLRLARRFIMVPKSRKHGQDHMRVVNLDHRNHYPYMRALLEDTYSSNKVIKNLYPFPKLTYDFNLFEIWQIKVNK